MAISPGPSKGPGAPTLMCKTVGRYFRNSNCDRPKMYSLVKQPSNPKGNGYRSDKGSLGSTARSEIEEKSDVERGSTFLSKSRHWTNTAFVFNVKEDDLNDHNKQQIHQNSQTYHDAEICKRHCH